MKEITSNHVAKAILTVDAVLLTLASGELNVALFRREAEPFKGQWALPGGYVHENEDDSAKAAAARVLMQKTAVKSPYLEEFGTVSGPARDPRGWSLSVVYYALVPLRILSPAIQLFPVAKLPSLPFDHSSIISGVVQRVRSKASYSSLPVHLCEEPFTISELHAVYERAWGAVKYGQLPAQARRLGCTRGHSGRNTLRRAQSSWTALQNCQAVQRKIIDT
jgi:8-oxo-dGTP diphosphatase